MRDLFVRAFVVALLGVVAYVFGSSSPQAPAGPALPPPAPPTAPARPLLDPEDS